MQSIRDITNSVASGYTSNTKGSRARSSTGNGKEWRKGSPPKHFLAAMISLTVNETLQESRLRVMQRLEINESITRRPESIFSDSPQLMPVNQVQSLLFLQ